MAYGLILISQAPRYLLDAQGYIHIENYFKDLIGVHSSVRGDLPKLRFWGLIQAKEGQKDDGNPSTGMYKITTDGELFVANILSVPRIVKIFNNKLYGFDDATDLVNIKDCLKNKFDYTKLMSNG